MGVSKKENSALMSKASICVMNSAFARGQANFIEIFPAIGSCYLRILFDLEDFKPFKL